MFALLAQAGDKAEVAEKAAEVAEKVAPAGASGWVIFCLMLAVVFVPYILGSLIGNALKLKDYNSRIGTVLFVLAACLTPFGYRLATADPDKSRDAETLAAEVVDDSPIAITIKNEKLDAVEVMIKVPALDNGDDDDASVDLKIELQSKGGGYNVIESSSITGLDEEDTYETFRLPLTGTAPWDIRVARVTEEDSSDAPRPFFVQTYTKIVEKTFAEKFAECFRLGIDLDGGTNLVYEIDQDKADEKAEKSEDSIIFLSDSLDNMVGAIARRVNPSGTEEVTVRRVGNERIEVIIPGADQAYVDEMKDRITRLGTLEFEILATASKGSHRAIVRAANKLPLDENSIYQDDIEVARWVDVVPTETISNGGEVLPAETRPVVREEKNDKGESATQQALVVLTPDDDKVSGEFL
ncbi:MAG: hypothetical protein H8E37_05430, partial [Planctomycetes bacterium]|nr:hypothetical protein [Planctomycetota bacterium]